LGRDHLDVYHSPSGVMPYTYRGNSIITIHDLAIYKHPEWFPEGRISKSVSTKMLVPNSVSLAKKIIAVSNSTKKDLIDLFNVPEEKIAVIYQGVELPGQLGEDGCCRLSQPVKKKHDISKEYFLTLGTLEPRKNISAVLDALGEILNDDPGILKEKEYLIAGLKGWKYEEIFNKIEEVNQISQQNIGAKLVRYLGYIQHSDKFPLIAGSSFFVFPSLYEGFGRPVLEAMKIAVPVITSNLSSLPEVCGDAALLVDPGNKKEIKKSLISFLKDEAKRREYARRAKARAGQFSWQKTASQTIEIYQNS
jgi:glycosyltransferase involved in cell wall biosynthesis